MGVTGSEWPKWGRNGPSALDTYLMYFSRHKPLGKFNLSLKVDQICMSRYRQTLNAIRTQV